MAGRSADRCRGAGRRSALWALRHRPCPDCFTCPATPLPSPLSRAQQDPFKSFVSVTQQGGTPNYMAPELFNGTRVSGTMTLLYLAIGLPGFPYS